MENTTFLAQLWGPAMLAVGLGMLVSRKYYANLYRDLEKNSLAVLIFAMSAIAVGVAQIMYHNVWGTFPEIVISLLGWGTMIKGLIFAIVPGILDPLGDWEADSNLIPVAGGFAMLVGAYLTAIGFLM
ncbi:hypothetical protein IPM19_01745 [bacterium]|nr:MAG: hypothetical protein IPM19_01745 [bacterium]